MARNDRWQTGWVVLPGELYGRPYEFSHRPDPDDLARAMCGIDLPAVAPFVGPRAPVTECGRCCVAIGRARKAAGQRRSRRGAAGEKPPEPKPVDLEAIDRRDRRDMRGTSVRTVRGGLPTLGRGHH